MVASAWEVEQSGDYVLMAYGKIRLGTKGKVVTKTRMKGNPQYFLQQ